MKTLFQKIRLFLAKPAVREIVVSIFIAALVSSSISYLFNKRIDKSVANRDFIFNFSRTFFDNPKYRNISIAIEESLVRYSIIEDQFYYYVCVTYQNEEIRNYRKKLLAEGFSEVGAHGFFDDLAKRFDINDGYNCKNL